MLQGGQPFFTVGNQVWVPIFKYELKSVSSSDTVPCGSTGNDSNSAAETAIKKCEHYRAVNQKLQHEIARLIGVTQHQDETIERLRQENSDLKANITTAEPQQSSIGRGDRAVSSSSAANESLQVKVAGLEQALCELTAKVDNQKTKYYLMPHKKAL